MTDNPYSPPPSSAPPPPSAPPSSAPPSSAPSAGSTTLPPPPPPPTALSLWRRSRTDRKVAGVCGGLGRLLGIDPLVIRVAVAVLTVFAGVGLLGYGVAWLLVPADGEAESEGERLFRGRASRSIWIVLAVCALGVIAVSGFDGKGPGFTGLVVLAVIGFATYTVLRRRGTVAAGAGAPNAGAAFAGSYPPYVGVGPTDPAYSPPRYGPYAGAATPQPIVAIEPAARPKSSPLSLLTVSVAAVVLGSLAALNAGGRTSVDGAEMAAVVLAILGAGLLVGAWWGHARRLAVLAVLAAVVLSAAAAIGVPLRGGVGERTWHPLVPAELSAPFRLGVGHGTLDLRSVPIGDLPVDVTLSAGVGQLDVIVPADVTVVTTGHAGVGNVRTPGDFGGRTDEGGTDVTVVRTDTPAGVSRGIIRIKADVGVGVVEVRRAAS